MTGVQTCVFRSKTTFIDNLAENKESNEESQHLKNPHVQLIFSNNSWLKPKNRAASCFGKVKTEWKPKTFYKQKEVVKLNVVSRIKTGETKIVNEKSMKVIQAWIPKGVIYRGPT